MPKKIKLNGHIGRWDIDVDFLQRNLPSNLDEPVTIVLNSKGGDPFMGLAIYQLLSERTNLTVELGAIVASAASFIPFAAKTILSRETSSWMGHRGTSWAAGNATVLAARAKMLDGMDKLVAGLYAKRTGNSEEDMLQAMNNEIWLFGGENIKKYGIADEVISDDKAEQVNPVAVRNSIEVDFATVKNKLMEEGSVDIDSSILNMLSEKKEELVGGKAEKTNPATPAPANADVDMQAAVNAAVTEDRARITKILMYAGIDVSENLTTAINSSQSTGEFAEAQLLARMAAPAPAPDGTPAPVQTPAAPVANTRMFANIQAAPEPADDVPGEVTMEAKIEALADAGADAIIERNKR